MRPIIPSYLIQPNTFPVVFKGIPYTCKVRILATYFILAFYLAFNIGLRVDVNYCGNRVSSVDLFVWQDGQCCGMEKMADCCSTESLVFQTTDEQSVTGSLDLQPSEDLFVGWIDQNEESTDDSPARRLVKEVPPELDGPPIYLMYSRLVYYG